MSFRQFPATDANGDSHIILEFVAEGAADTVEKRYELQSGEHLVRDGNAFRTQDGSLTLHVG